MGSFNGAALLLLLGIVGIVLWHRSVSAPRRHELVEDEHLDIVYCVVCGDHDAPEMWLELANTVCPGEALDHSY